MAVYELFVRNLTSTLLLLILYFTSTFPLPIFYISAGGWAIGSIKGKNYSHVGNKMFPPWE